MTITHIIEVEKSDPEYESHHQYEVKRPQRAEHARAIADAHRAAYVRAGGDVDAYKPQRAFPCPGIMRITNRKAKVWTIQCDECGDRFGAPRGTIDRDLLVNHRLQHSRINLSIATRAYEKTTGNEAARAVCRILVERWGTDLEPHGPALIGPTGRGKTHLLLATAHELIKRHLVQARYWSAPDLLAAARRRMDQDPDKDGGAEGFIARQASVELLVLDDLGAEQSTPWTQEVLQRVVDTRERLGKLTMIATNLTDGQWGDVLGERTASRLRGMTTQVEVHGEDYREKAPPPPAAAGNVIPLHRPDAPHDDQTHP